MNKSILSILLVSMIIITSCTPPPEPSQTPKLEPFIPEEIPGEVVYVPFPVSITVDGDLF